MTDPLVLHKDSVVVDTHNDLILLVDHFDRREQPDHFGQFWLPELRAGGVDVQVLPICIEDQFQSEGALRRTLLLIERIHELGTEYSDDVAVCLTGADVDAATSSGRIALVIALEGAHAIGQDPQLVRTLARVGVRVISMAHYARTFLADGSGLDSTSRSRLTPEGITALHEMEELGIVFDISHLGIGGVEDVLSLATRPFLATHSACLGITDSHRNLGDEQLKAIAELGGVIGVAAAIPFFIDAKSPTAERVVDHIERIIDVAGIDHAGLGPDIIDDYYQHVFGGWVGAPTNGVEYERAEIVRPSDFPKITEVMVRRGFSEADIRKILGENVLRVLRDVMGVPAR
ncbi:membrane dipeptidase [Kribbella pittospori]|uniref:Membrane dipeptidase n=1 Tax=Kribbella pittospori TaxID=722689 RepID=A0A4R0L4M4_9ACTN|nr:membrane dipeptidase [Kribbella pittospori]TCC65858.1 membrane dipeptidase [Kribbella pittospori]